MKQLFNVFLSYCFCNRYSVFWNLIQNALPLHSYKIFSFTVGKIECLSNTANKNVRKKTFSFCLFSIVMLIFARIVLVNFFYVWYSFFKIEYCDVGNLDPNSLHLANIFPVKYFLSRFNFRCFQFICVHFFEVKKNWTGVFISKNCKWNFSFFQCNRYFWQEGNEMQSSETFLFNEMYQITWWNKWDVFTKRYLLIAKTVEIIDYF